MEKEVVFSWPDIEIKLFTLLDSEFSGVGRSKIQFLKEKGKDYRKEISEVLRKLEEMTYMQTEVENGISKHIELYGKAPKAFELLAKLVGGETESEDDAHEKIMKIIIRLMSKTPDILDVINTGEAKSVIGGINYKLLEIMEEAREEAKNKIAKRLESMYQEAVAENLSKLNKALDFLPHKLRGFIVGIRSKLLLKNKHENVISYRKETVIGGDNKIQVDKNRKII